MTQWEKEAEAVPEAKATKEEAIQRAVKMYWERLKGPKPSQLGLRAVCGIVEKTVKAESGIEVKVNHETARARLEGMHNHFRNPPADPKTFGRDPASC